MPDLRRSNHEQSFGLRGDPVSLAPLAMDQAVDAIFAINPDGVKKVLASKAGKKRKCAEP